VSPWSGSASAASAARGLGPERTAREGECRLRERAGSQGVQTAERDDKMLALVVGSNLFMLKCQYSSIQFNIKTIEEPNRICLEKCRILSFLQPTPEPTCNGGASRSESNSPMNSDATTRSCRRVRRRGSGTAGGSLR
jgi:hypothetical protein